MYKSLESTIKEVLAESGNANSETHPTRTNNTRSHAKKVRVNKDGFVHGAGGYGTFENGGEVGGWVKKGVTVKEEETPVEPKDMPKPGQKQLLDQKKTETKADTEAPQKKNGRRDEVKLHPNMEENPKENPEPKPKESLKEGTAHGSHGKAVDGLWDDGFRVQSVNFTHSIGNTPTPRPGQNSYITKMKHARTGEELTVHTRKTALGHKTSIMEDSELDEGFFDGKKKKPSTLFTKGMAQKVKGAAKRRKAGADALHYTGRNGLAIAGASNSGKTSKPDYTGTRTGRLQRAGKHFNENSVYQLGLMQLQEDDTESFKLPSEQLEGLDESIATALLAGGAIGLIASAGIRGKGRKSRGGPHKGRKQYGPKKPKMDRAVSAKPKKPVAMNASAPTDHDDTLIRHARFQRLGILPTRSPGRTGVKNYISREHYLTLKRMHNSGASDKQLVKAHKELQHKFPLAANRSNAAGAHFMTHVHEARLSRKKSDEQLMAMIKKINPNHKDGDPTIGIKGSMGFDPKRGPQTKYSRLYRSQK